MKWLDRMERRFGKYAIHNLMNYIIMLYAAGFVIDIFAPNLYSTWLALDAKAILHGQIWRIFTFIIQPPSSSILFILFALYLYYLIGRALEYQWGAFRFNLYFFSGMLLHVIACLLIYLIMGVNLSLGSFYLNLSLFLVYAALFPDVQFMLFFIIPIKAKWLGIIEGVYYGLTILAGFFVPVGSSLWFSLLNAGIFAYRANSVAALVSLLNFIIFFLSSRREKFSPKQAKRRRTYTKQVRTAAQSQGHHRCAICGRTEADGDDLEFRFCSKCVGNYEYCQDHLFTHEHRK
ncbi:MAG: hypothetical protein LUC60_03335 [Lachnospiraceae bacterium]|nr:hypothetical protein [Lachnospiraceae bacterium]